MDYPIRVVDQADRTVRINEEIKTPISHDTVIFRGRAESYPVVRVPIEMLLYRMENGRTKKRQEEHIRRNKLDESYFLAGEENDEVQKVQHGILLDISQDKRADVHSELKHRGVQTENLLITNSGVVVNGNRRLAAMRDLLVNDGSAFKGFAFVNATVLPSAATLSDLEEIEADLQEIPETKLEYDWISRRLKLRRRRDQLQFSAEKLRKMYRFKTTKDINREIEQLELAEEYLERYLGRSKDYEAVDSSEQIFKQLQAALENKSGELEEMSRCIAFPLIKEARSLQDRVYQFRFAFGGDAEEVLRRVAAEEKIVLPSPGMPVEDDDISDTDDPLSGITEEPQPQFSALKPILLDEKNSQVRARQIAKVTGAIQQEKEEGGRKARALANAQHANRFLHDIELDGADPTTFQSLRAHLTSCISRANEILQKLPAETPAQKVNA